MHCQQCGCRELSNSDAALQILFSHWDANSKARQGLLGQLAAAAGSARGPESDQHDLANIVVAWAHLTDEAKALIRAITELGSQGGRP